MDKDYTVYVKWTQDKTPDLAKEAHTAYIVGYPDGTVKPERDITRAETMTVINRVLERAVDEDGVLSGMKTWKDNADTGYWAYYEIQEATNSHSYERTDKKPLGQSFYYEKWTAINEVTVQKAK